MTESALATKREMQPSPEASGHSAANPVVRLELRVRFGRLGFREARLLAKLSGGVAALGPDVTLEREEVA